MYFDGLEELPNSHPFAIIDNTGRIVYCNKNFSKNLDIQPGDSVKKINSDPEILQFLNGFINSNYSNITFDLVLNFGSYSPQVYQAAFEKILVWGNFLFSLSLTSLEERKLIEDRLNNLHNALEYGSVAVIITDEKGIINYSSKSFEIILKKSIENIFKHNLCEILAGFLTEKETAYLKFAIEHQKEWIKLISDISDNGELWFKELRLNPIKRSDIQSVSYILTANDITNYVLKNRLIRRSEERQKSIINNISDLLLIIKKIGEQIVFENANDNFYHVFNINKDKAFEHSLIEFIPIDLYDEIIDSLKKHESGKQFYTEFRYSLGRSNKEYVCKITATEDPYEKTTLFILSMSDITEQLLHEEKLKQAFHKEYQVNKLKTAFLANMSHEIRTPLNAIVGYSDLLEDEINDRKDESLQEIVNYLKEGVKRLLDLVDNIVEVSILESGETNLDLVKLNINQYLKNIFPNYEQKQSRTQVNIYLSDDHNEPLILADESKLKKVLDMIVDNAFKYNNRNGKIFVRIKSSEDLVRIEIEDTGIGIDPGKIEKILQPFMQETDEGYTRTYEGAGLGLTIAYRLTKLMGGRLDMQSKLEKGTLVYLTFQRAYR